VGLKHAEKYLNNDISDINFNIIQFRRGLFPVGCCNAMQTLQNARFLLAYKPLFMVTEIRMGLISYATITTNRGFAGQIAQFFK
jgi:hypothetical protein